MANPYGLYGDSTGGVLGEMGGGMRGGRGGGGSGGAAVYATHPSMMGGGGESGAGMMSLADSHLMVDANGAAGGMMASQAASQQQQLSSYGQHPAALSMHHPPIQPSKLQHYSQYGAGGDYTTLSPRLHHMANSNQQLNANNPVMNSMIRQQQQQQQHQMHQHQQQQQQQQHHDGSQQYQNPSQRSVYSMHDSSLSNPAAQPQPHLQQTQTNPMQMNPGMMWNSQHQYHHLNLQSAQHRPQQQAQQQSSYVTQHADYASGTTMELSSAAAQQQQQQQQRHYADRGLSQMSHMQSHKMSAVQAGLTYSYPDPSSTQRPTLSSSGGGAGGAGSGTPHMYSYGDVGALSGNSASGANMMKMNPYSGASYGPNGALTMPSQSNYQISQGAQQTTHSRVAGGGGGGGGGAGAMADAHSSRMHYTQLPASANGSPQYRASYPSQPPASQVSLSPRRPTPTPPIGSPMIQSTGCHTPDRHIMPNAAQAQGTYRTPSPSLSPSLGQSSLQQLEQMVMPHRSSPLPPPPPPSQQSQSHSAPFHHTQLGTTSAQSSNAYPGAAGLMPHHVSMGSVASPGAHNNQQTTTSSQQQPQPQRLMNPIQSAGHTATYDGQQMHPMYNVPAQNTPTSQHQQQQQQQLQNLGQSANKLMSDASEQLRLIQTSQQQQQNSHHQAPTQQQINSHLQSLSSVHPNQVNMGVNSQLPPTSRTVTSRESLQQQQQQQSHLNINQASMQMSHQQQQQQQSLMTTQQQLQTQQQPTQTSEGSHLYPTNALLGEPTLAPPPTTTTTSVPNSASSLLLTDSSATDAFLFDLDTQPLMPMAPQLIMPVNPEEIESVEHREEDQLLNENSDSPGLVTLDSRLGGPRTEATNVVVVDRFSADDICDSMVMTSLYPPIQVAPPHLPPPPMTMPPLSTVQLSQSQPTSSNLNLPPPPSSLPPPPLPPPTQAMSHHPLEMQMQLPPPPMADIAPMKQKKSKAPKKPKQPKAPRKNAKANSVNFSNSNSSSSSSCSNDTNLINVVAVENEVEATPVSTDSISEVSSLPMERIDENTMEDAVEDGKKPKKKKQYKKRKKGEEETASVLMAADPLSVASPEHSDNLVIDSLPVEEEAAESEIDPVSGAADVSQPLASSESAELVPASEMNESVTEQSTLMEMDFTPEGEESDQPPKPKKAKWKKPKEPKSPKEGKTPKRTKKAKEPKEPKEPKPPKEPKKPKETKENKKTTKEPKEKKVKAKEPSSEPKPKTSKLNKRRPTKILLSLSKKRRRASGSDASDLEGTPPPSPTAEAEGSVQKRRSARNTKRKKYTDDIDISISDDDDALPVEVVEKVVAQPTEAGLIKPVQFFVNPNDEDAMLVEKILAMRTVKKEKPKVETTEVTADGTEQPKQEENEDCEEIEEFYVKYKNFSYLHCDWKTAEELEKGDRRVVYKIKRYKQKKQQSNNIFEFLEEEAFNPEYVEIDRLLDVSETTDAESGNITKHYLVKWRGLAYDESTWELEEDIEKDKIEQFLRFKLTPAKEQLKCKKRPKPDEWVKQPQSREYKHGNVLREYQLEGLNWLTFCWYNGLNCILADEMGLGKTIQSIAFLCEIVHYGIRGPFLVIAPLSTITNWQREFETWSNLNVIVYHGSAASRNMIQEYETFYKDENGKRIPGVYKFNAMITTFEIIITDCMDLREIPWRVVIIDEAHRLKNKNCKLLEGLRLLSMEHRVLLSGTPLQNNVEELFSLLNFLEPVQFASSEDFMREFGDLKSESQVQKLQQVLKPMMLRRLKEDVEKSLAPKEETIIEVELTNIQKKYYRAILERNFSFLAKGTSASNVPNLMNTMMELRKCCIHPYLINGAEEQIQLECKSQPQVEGGDDPSLQALIQSSGKLVLIDKLLPKLRSSGHRVLIFSQMVRCLDILEDYLVQRRYPYERIDGRVRGNMRQAAIDRFSKPDSDRFVFLLCTRAGGLGINLTAADTVIIFDSDWNPQNDLQAQARCHRIGQMKAVKCYRLICRSTYEREMFDKASLKLGLDKAVLQSMNSAGKDGVPPQQLSKKEIEDLLRKGAYGAIMDDDNAADQFCEEDIDQILERRTQVIQLESGVKGSTFAKASFVSSGNHTDIDINDPDFWHKWAKKADIDLDAVEGKNELIVTQPRRRIQTRRFGNEDQMLELTDLESSDDDDNVLVGRRGGKKTRRKKKKEDKLEDMNDDNFSIVWGRSECFKVEKGLLIFGWGRWRELIGTMKFRMRVEGRHLEDIARIILLYCLNYYRGDEKIKNAIWELIAPANHRSLVPTENRSDDENLHGRGMISPTSRQRKTKKSKKELIINSNIDPNAWAKDPKYDAELWLTDETYKKHLQRHANRILLRIRLLCYLKQDIIGDLVIPIAQGIYVQDLKMYPPWPEGDPPVSWWDQDADKSILVGVYKHGYEKYNVMRLDPTLSFLSRCGPPDGAAVLAEINDNEGNEEEMEDKVQKLDEDEEALSPPPTPKRESTPMPTDSIASSEKDSSSFPSVADLNTRFRRLIAGYQRNHRKREQRLAQNAKRIERQEKFQAAVRERELRKRELQQRKWSRREESDFYRVVSTFGVEYNAKDNRYEWARFRNFARLEKKLDDTVTEYYKAFYSMCKKVCGKKLEEEDENHLIVVEPISEERARRCLEKVDLLNKIREEILYHPELNERLKLCKPSPDLPDWWICNKHDKELLVGAAKHGLGRLDYHLMNDPHLSFNDVLKSTPKPIMFSLRSSQSPLEKLSKDGTALFNDNEVKESFEDVKTEAAASDVESKTTKSKAESNNDERGVCLLPQVDLVVKPEIALSDDTELKDQIEIKSQTEATVEEQSNSVDPKVEEKKSEEEKIKNDAENEIASVVDETTVEKVDNADAKVSDNKETSVIREGSDENVAEEEKPTIGEEKLDVEMKENDEEKVSELETNKETEVVAEAQAEVKSEAAVVEPSNNEEVISENTLVEKVENESKENQEAEPTIDAEVNLETTDKIIKEEVNQVEAKAADKLDEVCDKDVDCIKLVVEMIVRKVVEEQGEKDEVVIETNGQNEKEREEKGENAVGLSSSIKQEPMEVEEQIIKNEGDGECNQSVIKKEEAVIVSMNSVDSNFTSVNYNSVELLDGATSLLANSYHNQVRWPKERVLQMRLEAVVHCVEKNEWPPMPRLAQLFSVPSVSQSGTPVSVDLDSSTPQGTPDHTPKRETPWTTPTHLSEKDGSDSNNPPEPVVNSLLFPPRRRRRRRRIDIDERGSDLFPSLFSFQLNQKNLSSSLHSFHQQQSQQQQMLSQSSQLYTPVSSALGLKLGLPTKTSTPEPISQISLVKKSTTSSTSSTAPPPAHQHTSSRMAPSPVLTGWDLKSKKPVEESAALDLSSNLKGSNHVEKSSFKYSLENIMASLGNKVSSSSPSATDGLVLDLQLRRQEKKQRLEEQLAKLKTQKTGDNTSSGTATKSDDLNRQKKRRKLDEIVGSLAASAAPVSTQNSICNSGSSGRHISLLANLSSDILKKASASSHQQHLENELRNNHLLHLASKRLDVEKWLADHSLQSIARKSESQTAHQQQQQQQQQQQTQHQQILHSAVSNDPLNLLNRHRRRQRGDSEKINMEQLTGNENVSVINRVTGKKITGSKAPPLKHLAEWLTQNPMFDVDSKWAHLVKEKASAGLNNSASFSGASRSSGSRRSSAQLPPPPPPPLPSVSSKLPAMSNLPEDLQRRLNYSSGRRGRRNTPSSTPTSSSHHSSSNLPPRSIPTSMAPPLASAYSSLPNLGALSSLANAGMFASFPGLKLPGLSESNRGNSSVGNSSAAPMLLPFGGLAGLGLTNPLFANLASLGFPGFPFASGLSGLPTDPKSSKEAAGSSASGGTSGGKSGGGNFSGNSSATPQIPLLFSNPGLLYNPLGLGGFSIPSSVPTSFSSLNLMNGLCTTRPGSFSTTTTPSHSFNTPSNLGANGLAAQDDSDEDSLKSLMGNNYDDDDSTGTDNERDGAGGGGGGGGGGGAAAAGGGGGGSGKKKEVIRGQHSRSSNSQAARSHQYLSTTATTTSNNASEPLMSLLSPKAMSRHSIGGGGGASSSKETNRENVKLNRAHRRDKAPRSDVSLTEVVDSKVSVEKPDAKALERSLRAERRSHKRMHMLGEAEPGTAAAAAVGAAKTEDKNKSETNNEPETLNKKVNKEDTTTTTNEATGGSTRAEDMSRTSDKKSRHVTEQLKEKQSESSETVVEKDDDAATNGGDESKS